MSLARGVASGIVFRYAALVKASAIVSGLLICLFCFAEGRSGRRIDTSAVEGNRIVTAGDIVQQLADAFVE